MITEARFVASYPDINSCPPPKLPEYAFIGRSNVGKSSLINMITGKKNLAKTSATPGKTQLINFFLVNKKWHLVDLPGYGFAKVAKTKRDDWNKMISDYLTKRQSLMNVFILVDSRHEPQKVDVDFINSVGENHIPLAIVFTKTDKISGNQVKKNIDLLSDQLKKNWEELPPFFITSSATKKGRDDLLKFITETNKDFKL